MSEKKPPPLPAPIERLSYSVPEAAEAMGVSESTVWRLIKEGDIPTAKVRGCTVIRKERLQMLLERAEAA